MRGFKNAHPMTARSGRVSCAVRRVRRAIAAGLVFGLLSTGAAFAVQPDEVLPDAKLEARARAISSELRCLVCQNQSIDDSDASLARDLRLLVRERLTQGATDEEVKAYLVDRYGEFVLLRPSFSLHNLILWMGPFAILLLGGAVVVAHARRRRAAGPAPSVLTPAEEAALDEVVGRGEH